MSNGRGSRRGAVASCAEEYGGDIRHARQVSFLALRLFDELQPLHRRTGTDREYLEYAALLHDIGWVEGRAGHHRLALEMIRRDERLPFNEYERRIIGNIARYHRKSPPKESHAPFAELDASDRKRVCDLAALLRVADGLDVTHTDAIREIDCDVHPDRIVIRCAFSSPAVEEQKSALKKSALFESVYGRRLVIE
jgi:exopolyphosphatase/guanosine-5'-triphosphate,3'-diphosphate pyrophosphatase